MELYYATGSHERESRGDQSYRSEVWPCDPEPVGNWPTLIECLAAAHDHGLGVYYVRDDSGCITGAVNVIDGSPRNSCWYYPHGGHLLRDLSEDWHMPTDSAAGLYVDSKGSYYVAWGQAALEIDGFEDHSPEEYLLLMTRWSEESNDSDGVEDFDNLEEAKAYARQVTEATGISTEARREQDGKVQDGR